MGNATLQDQLDTLAAQLKNHRCSQATVVYDAYCGCEAIGEEMTALQINIDHPHGAGLAADSYLREYLFNYAEPTRRAWEMAQEAETEPPF